MDNSSRDITAAEGGRINQGFELTSQNTSYPDHIVQRNLRNDLEAQQRHRENTVPINDVVNVASVTPSFSGVPMEETGEGVCQDSNTFGYDSTWVVPNTELPAAERNIEVMQEPNTVSKLVIDTAI